jgi:2-hydroxychromene-2-carboxylate isomerase
MMRVYIDFKSPAALLALKPTLALSQKLGQTFEYLPFRTSQLMIPAQKVDETKGETHRRVRALARRDTHLKYAAIQGTEMKFQDEPGNSDLALAALLFAKVSPITFMEAAFNACWSAAKDLNDPDVVAALLSASGHEASEFDAEKSLGDLQKVHQDAEDNGIIDTPAFVIDVQTFIGREHLPWIETLLET